MTMTLCDLNDAALKIKTATLPGIMLRSTRSRATDDISSRWSTIVTGEGKQPGPLSLVEECRGLALIGREVHGVATEGLLCHKEPARRIQSPLLGALGRKIPLPLSFFMA